MPSYRDLITEAAGLLEPSEVESNPEYLRGMSELIARACPVQGVMTEERVEYVLDDMNREISQSGRKG